jgi:hypothetical protein
MQTGVIVVGGIILFIFVMSLVCCLCYLKARPFRQLEIDPDGEFGPAKIVFFESSGNEMD